MPQPSPKERARSLGCWSGPVEPVPVGGGISNANFKVVDAGRSFFVRIGGDAEVHGVLRRFEIASSRAAHAASLSPELVHAEEGAVVFRYIEGRTLSADDVRDPRTLERIVRLVRQAHRDIPRHYLGAARAFWVFQVLHDYATRLTREQHRLAHEIPRLMAVADELESMVGPSPMVFGHHDLLAANLIDDGRRLWLVDWEYGAFGTPLFDLANLASNNALPDQMEEHLLELYLGHPPDPATWRSFKAMIAASLLREAMWSMVSEHHLAVDFDYVAYSEEYLGRFERALTALPGR
jgi:thiamine kinase-like enzyme